MEYKVVRKQENSKKCLVCGLQNDLGLKASFYELENNELVAIFKPRDEHQSYPERMHGGIAGAILDETIGRLVMMKDPQQFGVTVELNLKYKKPIPLDEELRVVARLSRDSRKLLEGTGEILLKNGEVAVTGWGKYWKIPMGEMTEFDPEVQEWKVNLSPDDPVKIDL
ncbi:HotDog domain [Syntrophomonas zehnderi OL-4]|uniref:HotDog domain n=1 Tax=Syntrophomonas zehnderi OL-4 TaxID=690567 RepID=A0A0E3W3X8_9FIRM|nr:PaaI family thioesterase [Syntrophomonas zehnderi]CFY11428.1 HotDog domain [Syntrophomonas zehnderi OL-4]